MIVKQKLVKILGSAFVIGGLLTGCAAADESSSKEKAKVGSEQVVNDDNVIEISAFEMGYTPETITLQKGEEYELVLKNDGKVFHDLTEKNLDVEITYMSEMADHPEGLSFLDKVLGVKKVHASGSHDDGHDGEMKSIHINAKSEQTVRIRFIPKETGEFKFYCSVPGHKEAGMVGKFIVK